MNVPERETRFLAAPAPQEQQMSTREFIGLVAAMMALTALAIDIMLPALPAIGDALGITNPNDRQVIIITYMLGFSIGQLGYGRLSDSYGRKPVLMAGLAVFIAGSLMASLSTDFTWLLVARTLQGLGAAAPRVIALAIVRDRYAGRQMARVMSFALAVFIIIPVLAPAMGQALLHVGTWRHVFDLLLVAGLIVALWAGLRLPETKRGGAGEPLSLGASIKYAVETPQTIGYAVSGGLLFGCVLGYVSSAQQIFVDIYQPRLRIPAGFRRHRADHGRRLADQRAACRASRHAPAVSYGAGRIHRAVGRARAGVGARLCEPHLFRRHDDGAVLPIRARRLQTSMRWPWSRRATMPAWRRRSSGS